uniref:BGL24 n=1 Tax=Arundo donax TaxID=35708 RepID=A0A0A8YB36_ARUDO
MLVGSPSEKGSRMVQRLAKLAC